MVLIPSSENRPADLFKWRRREREAKLRSFAYFPGSPCFSSMAANDAPDHSQPNARPFEFIAGMQAFEDAEKLIGILRIEPDAIVPHKINIHSDVPVRSDFDGRPGRAPREFPSVGDETHEYLPHHGSL